MDLVFDDLKNEVMTQLDRRREMVLATCAENRVTARMVSTVYRDLHIYFQTDLGFLKSRQMMQNPNVALCAGNLQIEGVATFLGGWDTLDDPQLLTLYRQAHEGSYLNYGHREHQTVVEVTLTRVTLWKYADGYALRDTLLIPERQAVREVYCKVTA
jgi:hypothetical protein